MMAAAQAILLVGVLLALVQLLRGPTMLDRILTLDLMSLGLLGVIAIHGARTNQPAYLDAAIVIALLAFLSTVALARHIHGRHA